MSDAEKLTPEEEAYFANGGSSKDGMQGGDDAPPPAEHVAEVAVSDADDNQASADTADATDGDGEQAPDTTTGDDKESRAVPYAALKAEREQRRQLQEELRRTQARFDMVLQKMGQAGQAAQPGQTGQGAQANPSAEAAKIPNPDEDFTGALKWTQDQIVSDRQRREQYERQMAENQRKRQLEDQIVGAWRNRVTEFRQENPDFDDAHQYLLRQRLNERIASGEPEDMARQNIIADEFAFVASAMQSRRDPAATLVQVAAARGWAPKSRTQPVNAAEKLAGVATGMQANKSLSSGGTGASARSSVVDNKAMAQMSEKEFANWLEKVGPDGFREAATR